MSVTDRPVGDVVVLDVKGEMINNKEYGSVKRLVGELLGPIRRLPWELLGHVGIVENTRRYETDADSQGD